MTRTYREPPAEAQGCGLLVVALAVGPLIGFFGPILVLELVGTFVLTPGESYTFVAFCPPLLVAALMMWRPSSRPWGVALFAGLVIGSGVLLIGLWLILSSTY